MYLTRALLTSSLSLIFLASAAPSSPSDLDIREAATVPSSNSHTPAFSTSPSPIPSSSNTSAPLIPPSWLINPDPLGLIALGDDGILRNLRIHIPAIGARSEHLRPAHHKVLAAIPLSPLQITHFINTGPLTEKSKQHYHTFFAGVDGHDVYPQDLSAPHPKLLPRSPRSVAQARELKERAVRWGGRVGRCWGGGGNVAGRRHFVMIIVIVCIWGGGAIAG